MSDWQAPGFSHLELLGEGSFGAAYLVRELSSGRLGVLKYAAISSERARADFRRESTLLKGVTSPYVAAWFGHLEGPDRAAIFMEAVPGVSLRALLDERGPLVPEAALTVLKGSLLGLAAAHERGVVHRDYKPANVMVRPDDVSKLIDFGIAGLAGEAGGAGTPRYMAPEQWNREPVGPAADVYAATCVFFECLTGRPPFAGTDTSTLSSQHLTAPRPVSEVPEGLGPLIEHGMATDPAERPGGAAAFVTELEEAAGQTYGPDWESRGWAVLRAGAIALSALIPALLQTAGATAGATGAGASGAGASGAGGSWVTGVAGKVALGVAGLTVAGTAGVLVVNHSGGPHHARATPSPTRFAVTLAALDRAYPGAAQTGSQSGRYVTVTGIADPGLRDKINTVLRSPVTSWVTAQKAELGQGRSQPSTAPCSDKLEIQPTVGLAGPRLLSVRYQIKEDACYADYITDSISVTVDLRTGLQVPANSIIRPEVLTATGISRLTARLTFIDPHDRSCVSTYYKDPASVLGNLVPQEGRTGTAGLFLTPTGISVTTFAAHYCPPGSGDARYSAVRDLINPAMLPLLPS